MLSWDLFGKPGVPVEYMLLVLYPMLGNGWWERGAAAIPVEEVLRLVLARPAKSGVAPSSCYVSTQHTWNSSAAVERPDSPDSLALNGRGRGQTLPVC